MGKVKQRFKDEWKALTDARGYEFRKWLCKGSDDYKGYCKVCKTDINVGSAGNKALLQHTEKKKHISAFDSFLKQPKIETCQRNPRTQNPVDESVTAAEIKWVTFICEHDLSANMSEDTSELFSAMFTDSPIAKSFTCGRTKATYLVTEGLGPYYHNTLVATLRKQPFSLLIDESNKSKGKKFLNILVRYYDTDFHKPITRFYQTKEVNRGSADVIVEAINEAFVEDGIPWSNVIHVMSDSPHVMRGSKNGVIAQIKAKYAHDLIDIGGCSLHYISNAVSYGTEALGEEVESFAVDVFAFFKHRTGLSQEFKDMQHILDFPEHKVLRFVSTRWISILPVCERLAEQWDALRQFFTSLKSTHPDVVKQDRTRSIMKHLEDRTVHSKVLFLTAVLPQLQRFEKLFQSDSLMIHALYDEMFQLLKNILVMFIKPNELQNVSSADKLLEIEFENRKCQLEDKKLFVGRATESELKNMKDSDLKLFYLDIRSFFKTVCKKLVHYLPLKNTVLRNLQFLHPAARQLESSEAAVSDIASVLQPFTHVSRDDVLMEWRNFILSEDESNAESDVAQYWKESLARKLPSGEEKFPKLSRLVSCAMSIAHGNAETERTFSQVSNIITKQRNCLGTDTLNGLMIVKNSLAASGKHAYDVEITPGLIQEAQAARAKYFNRRAKVQDEESERKRKEENDKVTKSFLAELNSSKNITSMAANVSQSEEKSENLRKKAQSYMDMAMQYNKQYNEAIKEATRLEKKNKTKQKQLTQLKEKHLHKTLKRISVPTKTEIPKKKQKKCESEVQANTEIVCAPDTTEYAAIKGRLGTDRRVDCVRGDGNCFFRAISKSVHGTELVHEEVRRNVSEHLLEHKEYFSQYIDGDVQKHVEGMKRSGKWATQAEVFAAASYYKTDVFVLIPVSGEYCWHKFAPLEYGRDCYLTLVNTNANHYDRVCSSLGKCNCELQKPVV